MSNHEGDIIGKQLIISSLAQALLVDHTWIGTTSIQTAGTNLTFGEAVYIGAADSKMEKALATGTATMPAIGLVTETINEDVEGLFLLYGFMRDDTWDWTPGGLLYISRATAGQLTQTLPATTGDQVQVVGIALSADIVLLNPGYELVEIS